MAAKEKKGLGTGLGILFGEDAYTDENELKLLLDAAAGDMDDFEINAKILRPVFGGDDAELRKAAGDYDEPIDWAAGLERLRKVKEGKL